VWNLKKTKLFTCSNIALLHFVMQMVQKLHSAALKIIQVFILLESIHESLKYESISHSVSTHPSRCKS